jgi:hypothetical protein
MKVNCELPIIIAARDSLFAIDRLVITERALNFYHNIAVEMNYIWQWDRSPLILP